MANFYVTHHRFPANPKFFTITLNKIASMQGEANPNFRPTFPQAEEYWKLFIYTNGLDSFGESVGPVVADVFVDDTDINGVVEERLAQLCSLIDWSQQGQFSPESDAGAPIIVEQYPLAGQTDVYISAPVVIRVQETLAGVGIDSSTVSLKINGIEVVPNVVGNKYDYTFSFSPRPIFSS